jgi:amino acid transporter
MGEEIRIESSTDLLVEEGRIQGRSAEFKKVLGLSDLVFTQILFIVGLPWVGVAAKQGPSHVLLWLLAALLFYLPSAFVVIYLNRTMPLEGGVYQWAKFGFNDMIGFLVAWNLWLFAILNTSEIGLQLTQYIVYISGPAGAGMMEDPFFIGAVNFVVIGALVVLTIIGLGVGKWLHKAGGALMVITFATIIMLPVVNWLFGSLESYQPVTFAMPVWNLMTLNLLGKMGFGAFGGFEYVAIHAGEAKDPVKTITKSVIIAAPVIAVLFILGTSAVLMLVPQDQIDLIAPVPQVLAVGFAPFGGVAAIGTLTIMALLSIRLAQASVMFGGNTRLPMVAGWDNLLPAWFTKLHQKYRTPVNSILFVGAATFFMSVVGLFGVGKQEAFQILWNASGLFYALTYIVMFAIPILGLRSSNIKTPLWLKAVAISGLLMTLLFVVLSMVPIINVENRLSFAVKIGGLTLSMNVVGLAVYLIARRRSLS